MGGGACGPQAPSLELCLGFSLVWPQSRIRTQGTASQRTANQVEL